MKNYVIIAHPNKMGITYAAFESVKRGLIESNQEVRELNLYEVGFDPVLVFDEQHKRRDMYHDKETQIYREDLMWADRIIFIYPTWWSGMPAILKGYIDRIFAQKFAYQFKGILPIGLLKGKTAWIVTTYDAPKLYAKLFQQDYGKVLKRQVLSLCGIKTTKMFVLASTKKTTKEKREAWLNKLYLQSKKEH